MTLADTWTAALGVVARLTGREAATLRADDRLDALGVDSLDRVLLAAQIEHRTRRPLPDAALAAIHTVGDVHHHLLCLPDRQAPPAVGTIPAEECA